MTIWGLRISLDVWQEHYYSTLVDWTYLEELQSYETSMTFSKNLGNWFFSLFSSGPIHMYSDVDSYKYWSLAILHLNQMYIQNVWGSFFKSCMITTFNMKW